MKLLLVDDDAFLRDMYAAKFTELSHEVVVAKDGEEALTILDEHRDFDVVVLDMVMPKMTGTELLIQIKDNPELTNLTCIILSNQGEQSDIAEATNAGAAGYIIKAESIPSQVVSKVEAIAS